MNKPMIKKHMLKMLSKDMKDAMREDNPLKDRKAKLEIEADSPESMEDAIERLPDILDEIKDKRMMMMEDFFKNKPKSSKSDMDFEDFMEDKFEELDDDGDGSLSKEEFMDSDEDSEDDMAMDSDDEMEFEAEDEDEFADDDLEGSEGNSGEGMDSEYPGDEAYEPKKDANKDFRKKNGKNPFKK